MLRGLRSFALLMVSLALSVKAIPNDHTTPRMTLTDKDVTYKRLSLHGQSHVELLEGPGENKILYASGRYLVTADFNRLETEKSPVFGKDCNNNSSSDCSLYITALHKNKDTGQLLICGTDEQKALCCHMNSTIHHSECIPSKNSKPQNQQWEPSLLSVSSRGEEFYTTVSDTNGVVGIYKFGKSKTMPQHSKTELRYLRLVVSSRKEDPLQDKLYAFYIEKNPDQDPDTDLWVPRVAQVCMVDVGGPKAHLQYVWTSQLRARLSCGDQNSKQYVSQLVDVVTLEAERWQDTKVYGLFRDNWGVSAVCVYTMADIDRVFTTSDFKGYSDPIPNSRPGKCVADSTKLPREVLKVAGEYSEMADWVRPARNAGPLLAHHHKYTHILADRVQSGGDHVVLFLATENGRIQKVLDMGESAFVIAEYQPFSHKTHILNMMIHAPSGKLYVSSSSELVQVDLRECSQYGDQCDDCVLARDPYCGWGNDQCTSATGSTVADVTGGDTAVCPLTPEHHFLKATAVQPVQLNSKHFLSCRTPSNHAQYSWRHNGRSTPCLATGRECLLLIESMGREQAGTYSCESVERDHHKTLAEVTLRVEGGTAGLASCRLGWVLLIVTVVQILMC